VTILEMALCMVRVSGLESNVYFKMLKLLEFPRVSFIELSPQEAAQITQNSEFVAI
jgi:hypothetical protein